MAQYTDGFVIAVPKDRLEAYRAMAATAEEVWRSHGALDYKECVGNDLEVEHGSPFPKLLDLGEDEVVIFSWILYESREARDRINAAVMEDPRLKESCGADGAEMPFEMERMHWGGFEVLVGG